MRTMRMIGAGLALVAMTSPSWAVDFETTTSVPSSITVNVYVQKYAEITLPSTDIDLTIQNGDLEDTKTSNTGSMRANVPVDVTLSCPSGMSLTAADGATALEQMPGDAMAGDHYEWNALLTVGTATAVIARQSGATLYTDITNITGSIAGIAPAAAKDVTVEASIKADSIWSFRGMGIGSGAAQNGGAVLNLTVAPTP